MGGQNEEWLKELAKEAEMEDLPLDKVEERLKRISRIIRNKIGHNILLLGIGKSGSRFIVDDDGRHRILTTYMEEEGINVATGRVYTGKDDVVGYSEISTDPNPIENLGDRPILLFDHTIKGGGTMYSALKWVLENDRALNLTGQGNVSVFSLHDKRGLSNFCLNPKVSAPKGPRALFLERLKNDAFPQPSSQPTKETTPGNSDIIRRLQTKMRLSDEALCMTGHGAVSEEAVQSALHADWNFALQLYEELKDKVVRHVNGEVYSFGKDPEWERKIFPSIKLRLPQTLEPMLKFIDGFPSTFFFPTLEGKQFSRGDKYYPSEADFGFIGALCFSMNVGRINMLCDYDHEIDYIGFSKCQKIVTDSGSVGLELLCRELDTDGRIFIVYDSKSERTKNNPNIHITEKFIELAKQLTAQGYRDYDNFRFVTVDPFKMYTVSDLFLEAFNRNMLMEPVNMGQNVADYCQWEHERRKAHLNELGMTEKDYKKHVRVIAPICARLYGIGLALDLGLKADRYVEIDDVSYEQGHTKLPMGLILPVDLDKVRELRR